MSSLANIKSYKIREGLQLRATPVCFLWCEWYVILPLYWTAPLEIGLFNSDRSLVVGPTPIGHNELVFADPDSEPRFVHVPDILGWYTVPRDDLSEALEVVVDSLKVFR